MFPGLDISVQKTGPPDSATALPSPCCLVVSGSCRLPSQPLTEALARATSSCCFLVASSQDTFPLELVRPV